MQTAVHDGAGVRAPGEIRDAIEQFLKAAKKPLLFEPGGESIALTADNFTVEPRGGVLLLQAWDQRRNLVRRITAISSQARGRLELCFERFDKKFGTISLLDGERAGGRITLLSSRLEFRERFRRFLRRQFPGYKLAELTTEPNLEDSLSPAYPRALLRQGAGGWAAIGAGPDCLNVDRILSFGLIWLDYLRRREQKLAVHGLILLLPADGEKTTCLRLRWLNPAVAEYRAFAYSEDGVETALDLNDYGNLGTRLERVLRPPPSPVDNLVESVRRLPAVEAIELACGMTSFRVRGLEFARTAGDVLLFGLETNKVATASNLPVIERLAEELARFRSPDAADRNHPLFLKSRELWLESQVRAHLEEMDAGLLPSPVYGQAPSFAAGERGIIDLLAVHRSGRLAVLELKASEDIHLPLQALDYWMRVKWHLDRHEFAPAGYFPGIQLRDEPPRILLVAPALDFHPTNERVLRYVSPRVQIERIGVGAAWQKDLKVMFRM